MHGVRSSHFGLKSSIKKIPPATGAQAAFHVITERTPRGLDPFRRGGLKSSKQASDDVDAIMLKVRHFEGNNDDFCSEKSYPS